MLITIFSINIILLIYSLFHLVRFLVFIKKIKAIKNRTNKPNYNLIIVIPCLNEQNTIEETTKYFSDITNKKIPLILVTTNKEKGIITTKDIIKNNIINKYSNVFLLNYPKEDGIMADQLNYVIKNIDKYLPKGYKKANTYFSVYNADSRPNINTFREFDKVLDNNCFPEFIQQYSYAFSNYTKLNIILKGFAIYQSNFELKCGLLNSYFNSHLLHRHLVGHGLFVRLDILNMINGFNSKFWCEDIYMTAIANNLNYEIKPLLCLENMETPDKISKLVKQNSVWFGTSYNNIRVYRDVFKTQNKRSFRGILGLISEFRSALNWLFFSIVILFLLISSLTINLKWFLLSFSTYSLYIFIYSYTTTLLINKLDKSNINYNFEIFLGTFIATLLSNIGPLYYLIIRPKEKYKTER